MLLSFWKKNNLFFLTLPIFILIAFTSFDPDLGFHLKTGELIVNGYFPRTDSFSFTMPSYPVISHEWILDVLSYLLMTYYGKIGLSIFFSIIAIMAVYIIYKSFGLNKRFRSLYLGIFLLSCSSFLQFFGVRMQVFSWFLFSVFYIALFHSKKEKWPFIMPMIFLFWANSHGSFVFGLVLLGVYLLIDLTQKIANKYTYLAFALSIFATFINPYGINLWREVLNTVSDNSYRYLAQEWTPGFLYLISLPTLFLFAIALAVIFCFPKKN